MSIEGKDYERDAAVALERAEEAHEAGWPETRQHELARAQVFALLAIAETVDHMRRGHP